MNNSHYDACLFLKSPVAQIGSALSEDSTQRERELASLQILGVRLEDLDSSGYLQNSSISVKAAVGYRAQADSKTAWKFSHSDAQHRFAQVMAYHWLNTTIRTMKERTGLFHAADKGIQVLTDSSGTGWNSTRNQIHLESSETGRQMAFDAGVMIHLLGEANIYHATQGAIEDLSDDTNHLDCGPNDGPVYEKDCCASKLGCSRAISAGASDYLVALIFPDSPTLGETWSNRPSGLGFCGVSRDLRLNESLDANQAYGACAESGAAGQIYVMGSLYASIWWKIRQQVIQEDRSMESTFDRLYMKHLALLDGADTFLTVLEKIKTLDQEEFSSRFGDLFANEYAARGLL